MLLYLGYGDRDFARDPRPMRVRGRWEFLAVLSGRCAPMGSGRPAVPSPRSLWLLPPDSRHGWIGDGRACRVLVVHAASVPSSWSAAARLHAGLQVRLTAPQVRRLDDLGRRLQQDDGSDVRRSDQLERIAIAELALLLLPSIGPAPRQKPDQTINLSIALAWFDEHMDQAPDSDALAALVGLSAVQLRRLCRATHDCSLGRMLEDRRLERARALLADPDRSMAGIARACGWRTTGALTHAMRRRDGCTPSAVRGRLAGC